MQQNQEKYSSFGLLNDFEDSDIENSEDFE